MRYFLWLGEKALGPFSADEVLTLREEGTATDETLLQLEGDAEWVPLRDVTFESITPTPSRATQPADRPLSTSQSISRANRTELNIVRRGTCYDFLRVILGVSATLVIAASFAPFGLALLGAMFTSSGGALAGALGVVVTGIFGVIACAITLAIYQACQLLIDIADILIAQRREQRERS